MKQREIQKCCVCDKGVLHSHQILFTRIVVERMGADVGAINRQAGLEMMLGGAAMLASVMGPDEDLAKPLGKPETLLVCDQCAMATTIADLWDKAMKGKQG